MKKITARFNSQCTETGKKIKKGEQMYYDYATKKCYCLESNKASKPADQELANFIQANEDAYFDNFCQQNNI